MEETAPPVHVRQSIGSIVPEGEETATGFWKYQKPLGRLYKHTYSEVFVAALIIGNFLTNMLEKTIDPDPDDRKYESTWVFFEYFYNVLFAIELGINMYSFWLKEFWKSGWNVFDFVVVSIGMCSVFRIPLPGPLKLLRMMRAFRVFRLFKRVKSLKKIMVSLACAIPGVINAGVILLIVMCIYSMLAVEFFRTYGEKYEFENEVGKTVSLGTARGQEYGWEYFGNFPKALYTMFQVLTGESWSEAIARPLVHGSDDLQGVLFGLLFVSFMVLNGVVLINVVVAVLLEKMVDEPMPMEDDEKRAKEAKAKEVSDLQGALGHLKDDMSLAKEHMQFILTALQSRRPDHPSLFPASFCSPLKPGPSAPPLSWQKELEELSISEYSDLPLPGTIMTEVEEVSERQHTHTAT